MSADVDLGVIDPAGVDTTNWRSAPFHRWAFHHVDKILPTAPIACDAASIRALPEAPMRLGSFDLKLPDGGSLGLPAFLKSTATEGLVILHEGRIVFEAYDNGTTRTTPHILMSVTKAMTGLFAGVLQQAGQIDIDAPVARYVPEVAGTAYASATLRNLLDMRTGVVLDAEQLQAYDMALRGEIPTAARTPPTFHSVLQTLTSVKGPHDGPFSYISANTDLLGWAMERATGRRFADLFSARLWRPMGAEYDAYIAVDGEGSPWCSGGLCIAVRDFARVGQLLLDGGMRESTEIVPKSWIDDLSVNGDRQAWAKGEWGGLFSGLGSSMSYRSGWYSVHDDPMLFAMGTHGQNLFVDFANRLVIAKVSSQARLDVQSIGLTHRAVSELRRCVLAEC